MDSIPFHPAVLAVCMLSVLIAGCGSGETNTASESIGIPESAVPPDAIQKIGTVTSRTRYRESDGNINLSSGIYASFYEYERQLTDDEVAEISAEQDWETEQGCTGTYEFSGIDYDNIFTSPVSTIPQKQSIAAGQVLSVMTPAGSWPDVVKNDSSRYISYSEYNEFTSPLPKESTIHIPGSHFPQFEAVPIPTVERLVEVDVTRTEQDRIMPDSAITWRAAADPSSHILIKFSVDDAFVDETPYDIYTYDYNVACIVADTGELTFPDSVKIRLLEYTATTDRIQMWRRTRSLSRQGDALLWMVAITQFEQF